MWVRPLIAASALCAAFVAGWYVNGVRHENASLRANAGRQEALNEAVAAERERADRYSQQVVDLLQATPPSAPTVRTIIRENPSPCVRPTAVNDSLQSALGRANAAISAAGGDGAVPANAREAAITDRRR